MNWRSDIALLLEQGNLALWAILCLALIIFVLFFERALYLQLKLPKLLKHWQAQWMNQIGKSDWQQQRIREAMLAQETQTLNQSSWLIKSAIIACPLLGLTGTVSGMILVFDELAFIGNSNIRFMSAGIFQATIPTMAGMVVAIAGLILQTALNRMNASSKAQLSRCLNISSSNPDGVAS